MLISAGYRELNQQLHRQPEYGAWGHRWLGRIVELMDEHGYQTVLDYGCGKGTLAVYMARMGLKCANYDPAVPEFTAQPDPADLVACLDVLEHVEPERIELVLAHIRGLALEAAFFSVALRSSSKVLADGRNAHLIIESYEWWKARIERQFRAITTSIVPGFGFEMLVAPK